MFGGKLLSLGFYIEVASKGEFLLELVFFEEVVFELEVFDLVEVGLSFLLVEGNLLFYFDQFLFYLLLDHLEMFDLLLVLSLQLLVLFLNRLFLYKNTTTSISSYRNYPFSISKSCFN